MMYQKPEVVPVGTAINAIEYAAKGGTSDYDGMDFTDPAYRSDE